MTNRSIEIPECDKLKACGPEMRSIRNFFEWLEGFGWELCHEHQHLNLDRLLYEYFDIDYKKLEEERSALLELQRKANEEPR